MLTNTKSRVGAVTPVTKPSKSTAKLGLISTRKIFPRYVINTTQTGAALSVPIGASAVAVKALGSGCKADVFSNAYNWGDGGAGAFVRCVLPCSSGETLLLYVGFAGNNGAGAGSGYGSSPGGFTGVARGTTPLVIAGGGGAGAVNAVNHGGPGRTFDVTNAWTTTGPQYAGGGYSPGAGQNAATGGGTSFASADAKFAECFVSSGNRVPHTIVTSDEEFSKLSSGGLSYGYGGVGPKTSAAPGDGTYGHGILVLQFLQDVPDTSPF